ncbi:MAG: RES family NAD+ phosphorylase [Gammaproteobacteria bacterium]
MRALPRTVRLQWKAQYRIVPSVYPPINFFEHLVAPEDMEALWYLESLTNDRLRHETGDIRLVALEDRISGPGASVVMAAFTHIGYPSRFTDGSFGVYYAARTMETAIYETVYHRERFLRYTQEAAGEVGMRVYQGKVHKPLHDIRTPTYRRLHDPNNYTHAQVFGKQLRQQQAWGIVYHSVRHPGGDCIAALRPPAISIPIQTEHLVYVWNGERITHVKRTDIVMAF